MKDLFCVSTSVLLDPDELLAGNILPPTNAQSFVVFSSILHYVGLWAVRIIRRMLTADTPPVIHLFIRSQSCIDRGANSALQASA